MRSQARRGPGLTSDSPICAGQTRCAPNRSAVFRAESHRRADSRAPESRREPLNAPLVSADTSGGGIGRQRRRQAGFRATQIGAHHQPVRGLATQFDTRATRPRDVVDPVGAGRKPWPRGTVRLKSTIRSHGRKYHGGASWVLLSHSRRARPGWTISTCRDLRERDNRERSTWSRCARPATTRSASLPHQAAIATGTLLGLNRYLNARRGRVCNRTRPVVGRTG